MKSFEERLRRLEEISRNINEECPLEEAIKLFEEGIKLSNGLEKELSKIERKVEILVNDPQTGSENKEEFNSEEPEKTANNSRIPAQKPALDLFPDLDD